MIYRACSRTASHTHISSAFATLASTTISFVLQRPHGQRLTHFYLPVQRLSESERCQGAIAFASHATELRDGGVWRMHGYANLWIDLFEGKGNYWRATVCIHA